MENTNLRPDDYLALMCGSSLTEDHPRDVDIFIYTNKDESIFSRKLLDDLFHVGIRANLTYLDTLQFHSLKYHSTGICYSAHIVSMQKLLSLVSKASLTETYTDVDVFCVRLYNQTVYRKWILDTEYLIGETSFKETLLHELAKQEKPFACAKRELVSRLKNNIDYFREKVTDDTDDRVTCNVLSGQIFNNLINYCYLLNNVYYGTVKYIKKDLESFQVKPALCRLTIDLAESLNIKSIQEISCKINRILDYIE